jgi:hypothetical protein
LVDWPARPNPAGKVLRIIPPERVGIYTDCPAHRAQAHRGQAEDPVAVAGAKPLSTVTQRTGTAAQIAAAVTEKRFALVKAMAFQSTEPLTATPQITARAAGPIPRRVPLGRSDVGIPGRWPLGRGWQGRVDWDRFAHAWARSTTTTPGRSADRPR